MSCSTPLKSPSQPGAMRSEVWRLGGLTLLVDPEGGRVMTVGLFATEEDYRQGDETLNSMDPPGDGFGTRASVTKFEVAVDVRM